MHGFLRELWQWLSDVNIIGIIATDVQFLVVSLESMDEDEPASSHLRKGLTVLQMLPDTPARLQHELALQTTLGPALIATKGYGVSEVAQAYTRARELCQQMGETPDVFPVLRGLWVFHEVRAELQVARELAEQLLVLAQRLQGPVYLIEAYRALGGTLFWLGQFAPARVYLEQAIALYDVQQHRSLAFLYGTDPAVVCP